MPDRPAYYDTFLSGSYVSGWVRFGQDCLSLVNARDRAVLRHEFYNQRNVTEISHHDVTLDTVSNESFSF